MGIRSGNTHNTHNRMKENQVTVTMDTHNCTVFWVTENHEWDEIRLECKLGSCHGKF